MDTKQAIDLFIRSRMAQNVTAKTISGYEWALDKKLLEMYPELPTDSEAINNLLVYSEYLSDASLVGLHQRLRTFFRWLERENLAKNPMETVGRPQEKPKLRRTLDLEQIKRLFEAANGPRGLCHNRHFIGHGYQSRRTRLDAPLQTDSAWRDSEREVGRTGSPDVQQCSGFDQRTGQG